MRVLVLFGAGASAYSNEKLDGLPPLGNKLFDKLFEEGGTAASLPEDIQKIFRSDGFESGMAAIIDRFDSRVITPFQNQMALHIAKYKIQYGNFYCKLISSLGLRARNVTFATLNYDLLLEQAICYSVMDRRLIPAYSNYNDLNKSLVRVIKLHGSCNFLPILNKNMRLHGNIFKGSSSYVSTGETRTVSSFSEIKAWMDDSANSDLSPALALYAKGKNCLTNAEMLGDIRTHWNAAVKDAKLIILIGVRYVSEDSHIWEPIEKSSAKLAIVNTTPEETLEWAETSRKDKVNYVLASKFSEIDIIETAIRNGLVDR